jgi:hypothetical protein
MYPRDVRPPHDQQTPEGHEHDERDVENHREVSEEAKHSEVEGGGRPSF